MGKCRWEGERAEKEWNLIKSHSEQKANTSANFSFFSHSFQSPRHSLLLRKFHLYNAFWLVSLEIDTFSHESLLIPSCRMRNICLKSFCLVLDFFAALLRPSIDVQRIKSEKFTALNDVNSAEAFCYLLKH